LDAIAGLMTGLDVAVLVADNDAENHEGLDLCRRLAGSYRWPLTAVIAKERGIAQVRNTLVEEALKDPAMQFIAMIDDDEWPEQDWLDQFIAVQRQTGAEMLQGSILFDHAAPETTKKSGPAPVPDIRRATGPVAMLQGAGNLLIARTLLEETPRPWFDPAFALTGGEDQEFFTRLAKAGRRFAWADEARAHGDVPEARRDLNWVLARSYSSGNSDMRVLLKHEGGAGMLLRESGKIMGAFLLSPLLAILLAASPSRRRAALQRLFRAAGKLTALFGARYNEYSVVHGE
jgi:GT2 family glycosyltransferase